MRFGPVGRWEILVIAFVVLLLFGGRRLVRTIRGVARALANLRDGTRGTEVGEPRDGAPEHGGTAQR